MEIHLTPIAIVKNSRKEPEDNHWGEIISEIILDPTIPSDAFKNITEFSHLEIIYYFNKSASQKVEYTRRPRGNPDFPEMGIFAQRNKDRPNQIGLCTVELIEQKGRKLLVKYLDAIDGTPVLDIKPVFVQFQPMGSIRQPSWVSDLTKNYW